MTEPRDSSVVTTIAYHIAEGLALALVVSTLCISLVAGVLTALGLMA